MDFEPSVNPMELLPDNIRALVAAYLDGRVLQCCIVFETADGEMQNAWDIFDKTANKFAMVGLLDVCKDDYKMSQIYVDEEGDQ